MDTVHSLAELGWQPFFQQQLTLDEWESVIPARVIEQHKSQICLATEQGQVNLDLLHSMPDMVVGDWVLIDKDHHFLRLLDRKTCFVRKAAGSKNTTQLISANVDTALIVCSMNENFNLNRIERYLSLVNESGAEPVVILSKSDLVEDPEALIQKVEKVQALDPLLMVEAINCLDQSSIEKLAPWTKTGFTIAVLGSSGVGKSTLVNTLIGKAVQLTNAIREDDDKGRHTTTSRSLIPLPNGGMMLDTPGMREIQLVDCKEGIAATFADIEALAEKCRFKDCQHHAEPGCAVQQAIVSGELDPRRLQNYDKLLREEALNSASVSERREKDRALGKYIKRTLDESQKLKGR